MDETSTFINDHLRAILKAKKWVKVSLHNPIHFISIVPFMSVFTDRKLINSKQFYGVFTTGNDFGAVRWRAAGKIAPTEVIMAGAPAVICPSPVSTF